MDTWTVMGRLSGTSKMAMAMAQCALLVVIVSG